TDPGTVDAARLRAYGAYGVGRAVRVVQVVVGPVADERAADIDHMRPTAYRRLTPSSPSRAAHCRRSGFDGEPVSAHAQNRPCLHQQGPVALYSRRVWQDRIRGPLHAHDGEHWLHGVMEDNVDGGTDELGALAEAYRVAHPYKDFDGTRREVPGGTLRRVLAAMDVLADTGPQVTAALQAAQNAPWPRTLPACTSLRAGHSQHVAVHVPDGSPVQVTVELEDGGRRLLEQADIWVAPREIDGTMMGRA